jgi:alpha-galactosidase
MMVARLGSLIKIILCATSVCFSLCGFAQKKDTFHQWAPTPPMGWNSWDCFGPTVTESEVKANADYMAKNLLKFGWQYIIVDIRWYVGNDKAHGYNETNPDFTIDQYGRYLPAVNRFPSAKNGKGFKLLADYIHQKGLKFGIHIMRGVPVIAVKNNTLIEGTNFTAAQIFNDKEQCTWLHDNYTVDASKPGAQQYYNSLFKLYASWGLDFVKVDDLTAPYHSAEVEMIRKAIDNCGRKILLSTSPGETPIEQADHVQQHANMWRTVGDFWDSWLQLKEHFDVFERWNKWRIKGGYPDGDMLPLGHIGIRAERGDPRMSSFTRDEQYTLMTLWSIFKSPLMFGGHLPDNDAFTLSLLTNKDMLNVLKNSTGNRQLFKTPTNAAWTANDGATKDKYLAVFNTADQVTAVEEKAVWKSSVINKKTVGQQAFADINIAGAKKLYLVVTDGGDDSGWDHGDWLAPTLYNDKDSLLLTSINWVKASAGWEKPQKNLSVSGNKLIVSGVTYANGIGTHSNSIIEYDLPEGFTHFKTGIGLDNAAAMQNTGATVQFMIFTENPSGPALPDSSVISVQLSSMGINSPCIIKDIWSGKTLGEFSEEFAPSIPKHGCGFYKISAVKNKTN